MIAAPCAGMSGFVGIFMSSKKPDLARRLVAEFVGTAFLLAVVIGSGIMGERLAGGNVAIALLANSTATGAGLVALILMMGPVSGAHFNPAVSIADAMERGISWRECALYSLAQIAGGFVGVMAANVMFELPPVFPSQTARGGYGQLLSEVIATFGLIAVIFGCVRVRAEAVPVAVGTYIASAYWFTASTSFANPAVTLARTISDTFAGIRPADAPAFIAMQLLGAVAATLLFRWLQPGLEKYADRVVMPHDGESS